MKTFILSLFLSFFSLCGFGQQPVSSPRAFKAELERPDMASGARVTVSEPAELEGMLNRTHNIGQTKVRGYRIRIFFDNSQNARSRANSIQSQFEHAFPDIPSYMIYEEPYFKVAVGNCLTMDEAMIVWGRVKSQFPLAFIVQEEIPLSNFLKEQSFGQLPENGEETEQPAI